MAETDLCPMASKPSDEAQNQPRTVAEANLALLRSKRMCDVTFVFGQLGTHRDRIQAHQFCLRARSLVFDLMFRRCKMGEMTEVEMPTDVNPGAFKDFLEVSQFLGVSCHLGGFFKVYLSDKFDCSLVEAIEVLHLAEKYRVQPLIEKCEEVLKNEIQVQDAIKVFEAARKYGSLVLKEKAGALLARNIEAISEEPYFLEADICTMDELFGRDDLMIDQVKLFQLAVKWGEHQVVDYHDYDGDHDYDDDENGVTGDDHLLQIYLERILPLIRFRAMTAEQFATVVIPTKLLSMDKIVDICTFFATKKGQRMQDEEIFSPATVPSTSTPAEQLVSFYPKTASPREINPRPGQYVETFSFSVRVQETQPLTEINQTNPLITGIALYLPKCTSKRNGVLEFVLYITQFQDHKLKSNGMVSKRRMFVHSDLGGGRTDVDVVPPLELANGHHYGIVLKDDTCHQSTRAAYSWSERCDTGGKADTTAKLDSNKCCIEILNFRFPPIISSYRKSHHVETAQAITGIKVVVP